MSRSVEQMIDDVIRREGGYVDHPRDRGGPTKFGITQSTLSRHLGRPASADDVRVLTPDVAAEIYRRHYYEAPGLDLLPPRVQPFVFDAAVNHGPGRAIRFVQEVCNAAGFGPLAVDGVCGPRTAGAAAAAERAMGDWFLAALVEERRNFYLALVERDPGQRVFLNGWLNRLAEFDVPLERLVA
ncbi:MAG TPA: glycosyl hydrolase 108 family protein [Geminicoccaceae bacterium]|nr:glycosyl hydrolase 108 family protein [Geminicoccaceae bacterium]